MAAVKYWVEGYDRITSLEADLDTLVEFGEDAADDIDAAYTALETAVSDLEIRNMLSEEFNEFVQ